MRVEMLLGMYVSSGEDCASAVKGKGKVGTLKRREKHPRFHKAFRQIGEEWNLKCKIVGDDEKLTSKSKIDLVRLPPCHPALKPHLQR